MFFSADKFEENCIDPEKGLNKSLMKEQQCHGQQRNIFTTKIIENSFIKATKMKINYS